MRKLVENLIKKKIDTEEGIRYILCAFGAALLVLNPYLITDSLAKVENVLAREADSSTVELKSPTNVMQEITHVSWSDLKFPHLIKFTNQETNTSMFYITPFERNIEEAMEDLDIAKENYVVVPNKSYVLDQPLNNVFLYKKKNITINDHEQKFVIDTYFTTVGQVLNSMTIKLTDKQEKNIDMSARIEDGMMIDIPYDVAEKGYASWYGPGFDGRMTANGETYDMYAMTAAHKSLPFDTNVRVINTNNGRSCIVRINDRGPYVNGRIIDLTYTAKEILGIDGVAKVNLEIVK